MEQKENPSASWALWVPTLWLLKIETVDLAYWLGKGDAEQGAGSPYERYLLIFLLFLGLLILYRRRLNWYKAIKDNAWLMVLLCYMLISIFWSDTPFTSFKRWTREFIAVTMAFVIFSETNPRKAIQSVLKRSIYVVLPLSLIFVVFFPDIGTIQYSGVTESWKGITGGKNQLGRACLIALSFLIWLLISSWQGRNAPVSQRYSWVDMVILIIAIFLMKGPGIGKMLSITSIVTLVIGLGTFLGLLLMHRFKRVIGVKILKVAIVSCIILGTASVFVGGLVVGGSVTEAVGREATLTGRIEIWAKFLTYAMEEPLIGHGVGGFWTDKRVKVERLNQAHNGYLDILLDYGFLGLLLFSLFLLSSCHKAHNELLNDYNWGSLWMCFIMMSVIYNIAEATSDSFTSDLTAVLLFLYVSSVATPNSLNGQNHASLT